MPSGLVIKIPARSSGSRSLSPSSALQAEPSPVIAPLRRKGSKRRIYDDSDTPMDVEQSITPEVKTPGSPYEETVRPSKRARIVASDDGAVDPDMDVDMGDNVSEQQSRASSSKHKGKNKAAAAPVRTSKRVSVPTLKKRAAITFTSDEDEKEDEYQDDQDGFGSAPMDEGDDDDVVPAKLPAATARRQSMTWKGKQGQPSKIGKVKGKTPHKEKVTKDITMKDERKLADTASRSEETPSRRATPKAQNAAEPTVEVVNVNAAAATPLADEPPAIETPAPEIPKKRKLPTIKKTKTAASTAPSTPLVPTPPPVEIPEVAKASTAARKPAALAGSSDFDLRNRSIYEELFKKSGGSGARAGVNRREKEDQRRKELDKMRDDARAKRAVEAKNMFDLQAQYDKISRFEEYLRRDHRVALYPNTLAAKFKLDWQRRRDREEQSRARKEDGEVDTS